MKSLMVALASLVALVSAGMVSVPAAAATFKSSAAVAQFQLVRGADIAATGQRAASRLIKDKNHVLVALGSADQSVPAGHLQITAQPVQNYGGAYINVPLDIRVNGTIVRTVYAGYRMVAYSVRSLAAHALPVGHVLTSEDFTSQRVPDTGAPTTDVKVLLGRSLVTNIEAGAPVTLWQTTIPVVVHTGDAVLLVIRDGPVALAADCVARSSGGVGQSVSVYDEREDHTLNAVVTAPGQVELRLPEVGDS